MAPGAHFDFSLESFLTVDDGQGHATLAKGIDGQPMRIVHDVASDEPFVQVLAFVPTDLSQPKDAKRKEIIDGMLEGGLLVGVSGRGVWAKQSDLVAVLNTLK